MPMAENDDPYVSNSHPLSVPKEYQQIICISRLVSVLTLDNAKSIVCLTGQSIWIQLSALW